ncbi:uncharacterized protein LOC110857338 [Folsomia candida]|nr:uncharacterized protein LOC110857338 [Folsomia candida]
MDPVPALLVGLLLLFVVLIVGLLLTYCYRRCNGSAQEVRDTHGSKRCDTVYYKNERRQDPYHSDSYSKDSQQAYENEKSMVNEKVKKIRNNLLKEEELKSAIPFGDDTTIIIGVDATPHHIGGYFINLAQKRGEFYHFPVSKLPWTLTPKQNKAGNSGEFEMKNLMFALYLWKNELPQKGLASKAIVYTDNFAYHKKRSTYGIRAKSFIQHLQICEGKQIQVKVKGTNEAGIEDHASLWDTL